MEALVDASTITQYLQGKEQQLPSKLKELASAVAFTIQREISKEVPVQTRNLQSSTKIDNLSDYMKRIYIDLNQAKYGEYIITGTRPHEIFPVEKEALYWPKAKHPVKRVMHPGTKPNDYFSRGVENAEEDIQNEIDKFKGWLTA